MSDASDLVLPDPIHLPPLDASRRGQPVRVLSTKYDGSPHYDYQARIVDEVGGVLRVVADEGTAFSSYRTQSEFRASMTLLFFTDRWYNVYHNHRPIGRMGMLSYANVSTPARLEGDTIHWVDLDLDVIDTEHQGLIVDDEDEFEEHLSRMAYPDEVIRRALESKEALLRLAREHAFPFNRDTHLP